jgi:hypothetical protein
MKIVYEFASETPLEEISFILDTRNLMRRLQMNLLKAITDMTLERQ